VKGNHIYTLPLSRDDAQEKVAPFPSPPLSARNMEEAALTGLLLFFLSHTTGSSSLVFSPRLRIKIDELAAHLSVLSFLFFRRRLGTTKFETRTYLSPLSEKAGCSLPPVGFHSSFRTPTKCPHAFSLFPSSKTGFELNLPPFLQEVLHVDAKRYPFSTRKTVRSPRGVVSGRRAFSFSTSCKKH